MERGRFSNAQGDPDFNQKPCAWLNQDSITAELHMDDMFSQVPEGCGRDFRNVLANFNAMQYQQAVKKVLMHGDHVSILQSLQN